MGIKYSCFIRYPYPKLKPGLKAVRTFIRELKKSLEKYISMESDEGNFYVDFEDKSLLHGDTLDITIGKAICQSACMIIIYTGIYSRHPRAYALRELLAMERIEEKRKHVLGQDLDRKKGMIIPIVLKLSPGTDGSINEDEIPKRIRDRIEKLEYNDFSSFYPGYIHISRVASRQYNNLIKKIALRIANHYSNLKRLEIEGGLNEDCTSFLLPSEDEATKYYSIFWGDSHPASRPFFSR